MTSIEKKIVWEKWKDPYDETDDWFPKESKEPEETSEDLAFEEEDVIFEQPMQLLMTNMGVIPFGGMNNTPPIGKIFNFWTGHTSFSISSQIASQMELVEGVEVLDIYTRYRFRVGIGKLFKDREVMNAIQQVICSM